MVILVSSLIWIMCVLPIDSSPEELKRRVLSLSLTRTQETIQPTYCWIDKNISLVAALSHSGDLIHSLVLQARRQGGFEGVRSNPPFGPQKILYTLL